MTQDDTPPDCPPTAPASPVGSCRKASRRAAILETARALFFERGYADTPMSLVACQVGGSKSTLWNYFPSKRDLFAAVLDEVTTRLQAESFQALNPDLEMAEALYRFCLGFVSMILSEEAICLHRMVTAEARRFPELGTMFYERGPKITHRRLAEYLNRAMDAGQLRAGDPLLAARHLTSLCQGWTLAYRLWNVGAPPSSHVIADEVRQGLAVFLRAYAP
ncbi:TetR/AcrR family transcriptional regulator [Pararhodospirillum photometricum]|uniref:Transcriptional regulator, TetR family protein n=1 Tax=Pararhodospirillum photometricum DSM 122 TaxID=1150469 RepID=H6SL32_PARPM|nr:TetR/AcrR family transcriptional regulator [Pararhodospirillum photometricum]CCG08697.1 Transcriptional regulator, TetR family protein [Pararhodospirillum photometricum DSM 122]